VKYVAEEETPKNIECKLLLTASLSPRKWCIKSAGRKHVHVSQNGKDLRHSEVWGADHPRFKAPDFTALKTLTYLNISLMIHCRYTVAAHPFLWEIIRVVLFTLFH
jgi:hypothetical protein